MLLASNCDIGGDAPLGDHETFIYSFVERDGAAHLSG